MPTLLIVLGISQLALGGFMAAAPGTFFDEFAAYGAENDHYIRDVSTFYLALGAVLLAAASRPSWRVPVLAFAALQYALHTVNHAIDVGDSDPAWIGPANLASLALVAALLGYTWLEARREAVQ